MEYTEHEPTENLEFRTVFMEDVDLRFIGKDEELDVHIWFASPESANSWLAFVVTDEITDPEEIMADHSADELARVAMYLGRPWESVSQSCPHCVAEFQIDSLKNMPDSVMKLVMTAPLEKIEQIRDTGRFRAQARFLERQTGVKISLN